MDATVTNRFATGEAAAAVRQMEDVFGPVWAELVAAADITGRFGSLSIHTAIAHPATDIDQRPGRGTYHETSDTYFIKAQLDYAGWVLPDWDIRTRSYAVAVKEAIRHIAKTRIDDSHRQSLLDITDRAQALAAARPPAHIVPLGSIWLIHGREGGRPMICLQPEGLSFMPASGGTVVEVKPEDAIQVAASLPPHHAAPPEILRLYRRDGDRLHFYEAFVHDGQVVEHEGVSGVGGENRFHPVPSQDDIAKIMRKLKKAAKAAGYQTLPTSAHKRLIVEYAVRDGFAGADELTKRHVLEDHLQDLLGQLGLGWCDGGSSGQGTMEVCCYVADFDLAKASIETALTEGPFNAWRRIYRET